ncbi:MAG: GGDEF domain-containing protein [Gemmatimonadaceae bacterium]
MANEVLGLVGLIGAIVQLGGCVLLLTLFALLRRYADRRSYFSSWGSAWLALTLAITAIVFRYNLLPSLLTATHLEGRVEVQSLHFFYQSGKLMYLVLLAAGTAQYAVGLRSRAWVPGAVALSILYAGASVAASNRLTDLVVLQAPVAVSVFIYCALTLLRLPPLRRSLGSRVTGVVFAMMAVSWVFYFGAFGMPRFGMTNMSRLATLVISFNTYLDLVLQMLLGYAMVLLFMEDAKREVDDAHAELAIAHDQLSRAALYDTLTGALNRRAFAQGVGLEAAKATFGTVAMLDMDNLKFVNDSYGHASGDDMLRYLVAVMREALRPSDRIYRWGGDEFLMVLPGAKPDAVLNRMESILAAAHPLHLRAARDPLRLVASYGAAEFGSGEDLLGAIERADAEMYKHKHRRRTPRSTPSVA